MTTTSRRNDYLPLTPLQEGLLFECSGVGAGDPYLLNVVADLGAGLQLERLHAALDRVLVRYPNLGACFRYRDNGAPVQIVQPEVRAEWRHLDLSDRTGPAATAEVERHTRLDRERGFDLSRAPLLRATVLTRPDGSCRLLLAVHHIVVDGWSVPLLLDALAREYASEGSGLEAHDGFRRYLGWVADRPHQPAVEAWAQALGDLDGPTLLDSGSTPIAASAPSAGTPTGSPIGSRVRTSGVVSGGAGFARFAASVDAETAARLNGWTAAQGVTVSSALQACWAMVLGQATHRDDIVFGQVDSGRGAPVDGLIETVGAVCATYPVRVRLRPGVSIGQLVTGIRDAERTTIDHRTLGLGAIQRAAGLDQLFDTMLTVQNYPMIDTLSAGPLPVVAVEVVAGTTYAATLTVTPGAQGLDVVLDRRSADGSGRELLLRFVGLIAQIAECDPALPVAGLHVATAAERRLTLDHGQGAQVALSLPAERIAERLVTTPLAVRDAEGSWSGEEVLRRAHALARVLVSRGVGPECVVGLAVPRTVDAIVGMLAVLMAGGAYLYLDAALPTRRLADMVDDARPALVIGSGAQLRLVAAALAGAEVLQIDDPDLAAELAAAERNGQGGPTDAERVAPLVPGHPAYIVFTSGSTGRPKGVVVTHGSLSVFLQAFADAIGLAPDDRMLAVTTFGFDICHAEVLAPLLAGAAVIVADDETVHDASALAALVRETGPTVVQATPVHWRELARSHGEALHGLRVVCGGESLTAGLAAQLTDLAVTVHNVYGPTETTIWSTAGIVAPHLDGPPDIGRPLPGNTCHVLDDALRPVPAGCVGELYIGGRPSPGDTSVGRA